MRKKGERKRREITISSTNSWQAYPPHCVGFCTLLCIAGPGLVSVGLKTSSALGSVAEAKLGTENRPPAVLVVFSFAMFPLVSESWVVEETPCAKSKAEVEPPAVLVVSSCVDSSLERVS
jgi:hypothetical protein